MNSRPLSHAGYVALPKHGRTGGFDHAAVHAASGHVYVAHTANDAVDVFDPVSAKYLLSVPDLPGVAGLVISDEAQLVITSNRAENTIGLFAPGPAPQVAKITVGLRPNGLACDPGRRLVLVANVGDPALPRSHTLSMVDLDRRTVIAEIEMPGRTRWAVFDPEAQSFYVNIADPARIVVVDAGNPGAVARALSVPATGPHGLDIDLATGRLFCACDAGTLVAVDALSGRVLGEKPLSGAPDVVFFNPQHRQLYVAVGEPGVIDVFDTSTIDRTARVETEKGAHTLAIAPTGDRLYCFLPTTHRATIYEIGKA
jgi:DNA-binding beta-propeller fold protein YncE